MINQNFQSGYVDGQPRLASTPSGAQVCSFTIRQDREVRPKGKDPWVSKRYIQVEHWGEIERVPAPGDLVCVIGEDKYYSYKNKQGEQKSGTKINAHTIKFFLGATEVPKDAVQQQEQITTPKRFPASDVDKYQNAVRKTTQAQQVFTEDDIPF